jgi:hypothetical protein
VSELKVYIGCALSEHPKEVSEKMVEYVEYLKSNLSQFEMKILDFVTPSNNGKKNVYLTDMNTIRTCDVVIALCHHPSTGLGMEIQEAIKNRIQVIALSHRKRDKMSKMITGPCKAFDHVTAIGEITSKEKALATILTELDKVGALRHVPDIEEDS